MKRLDDSVGREIYSSDRVHVCLCKKRKLELFILNNSLLVSAELIC